MQVVETAADVRRIRAERQGSWGLAPTMGALHAGHLALVARARRENAHVGVSIFVNPSQFGPGEDLAAYPRDLDRDLKLLAAEGIDLVWAPPVAEVYPPGYQTWVSVEEVARPLEGAARPGHFRGVATVCAKLFNLVKPHAAVFGKKDFQQLVVIKRMVADLNMDLEIIGLDTVREADGLAMSSRNTYLKPEERQSALSLSRGLKIAQGMYATGERDAAVIIEAVSRFISGHPHATIDYVNICDTTTMKDVARLDGESVMALAVRVGAARLIDNSVFGEPLHV